jgi:hypothetical protein
MKHICDGHKYRTDMGRGIDLFNNYGTLVAIGTLSPCSEYWNFETLTGVDCGGSDSYHVNDLEGFGVEQQLVRWFAGVSV